MVATAPARSAEVASHGLVRGVAGDAEGLTDRVTKDLPAPAGSPVLGAQPGQPGDLGRDVVGPVVQVCMDPASRVVEDLEEKLKGRACVVVPLPGELGRLGVDPSAGEQSTPEGRLAGMGGL